MKLSLITPTGGRPEAFALCEQWVGRQTLLQQPEFQGEWEWIVTDDFIEPTTVTMGQVLLRPEPFWQPNMNTQYRNLLLAVEACQGEVLVVIEDDDYYGPGYLEQTWTQIQKAPLVGETPSRYFNVRRRTFREFTNGANRLNQEHAAFCQTAFRRELLPGITKLWHEGCYPDLTMWRDRGRFHGLLYPGKLVVGIKGMPGRTGVSRAHKGMGAGWFGDPGLSRLRQWIGRDVECYRGFGQDCA